MKIWIINVLLICAGNCFAQQITKTETPYQLGIAICQIDSPDLDEVSGLVFGRKYPNRIYLHNDSGGEAAVFVIDSLGNRLGKIELEGVKNRDWEEIAIGPGKDGSPNVYVGEIGDNLGRYENVSLFRFEEPKIIDGKVKPEKLVLTYPKGPMDAEAMFVDPLSEEIFIFSKRDSLNTIFKVPITAFDQGEAELIEVGKLPFTSVVAADISQDGLKILLKTYFAIYFWERSIGETVEEALKRKPIELPYSPEPQGEAIGFTADATAFYTLSEKRFEFIPVLNRYPAITNK